MDFTVSPELVQLRQRVRAFVDTRIVPKEDAIALEDRAGRRGLLHELQSEAKREGLWTPHLPRDLGGLGLGALGMCVLFREMGRSLVAPRVFNCDAPDQGNMDLLVHHADPSVRERWLAPLCRGEITSAFCMTEPAPGCGSDPSLLRTRAAPDGDGFRITGHKWYSSGGGEASFLLVVARTSDDPRTGATIFVVDRHAEGVVHVRDVPTVFEPLFAHREAEMKFEGVRVPRSAVLGGVGEGFRLIQARLVPARLTHCMRWLGLADRALHLCKSYLATRKSFGRLLADHQLVQEKIARNAMAIHAGNLMTFHAADMVHRGLGREARVYSSIAKTQVARTLCQVLDDAIQLHGGLGISQDVPFGNWWRTARAARIADGPDEVHESFVAREFLSGKLELLV